VVASAAAAAAATASPVADAAAVPEAGGWTPLWRADDPARFATGTRPPAADMGSVVTGDVTIQLQTAPPEVQAVPRAIPRLPSASTESKMGWESQRQPRSPGGMSTLRFALLAVPLIALIVVGLWLLVGPDPAAPVAPAAAPAARPPPVPTAKPIAPAPDTAPSRGGNAPVTPAGAHARPEPHSELRPDPAAAEPSRRSSSRHTTAAKVVEARVSAPPAPAGAPASAQAAAPPAAPAPMPASNAAAPPQTAPAFPPMPTTARPAMSRALVATLAPLPAAPPSPAPTPAAAVSAPVVLSRAAIERVAADHARALSKCDAGEPLHGEVAVRFLVNAQGKVDKAQLAMPLRKPKVAACILRLVQKWQFPPQPASGAQGTYTLSFR
jgi:TonB family protein